MSSAVASYRLRELFPIGRGGMGTTHLACASAGTFERLVVVKRLNEHLLDEPDARQRLQEEAQLAAYVHHANVVGIHHAGFDDRGAFLVLDYVEGASLRQLMRALQPQLVPEPIVLRIVLDALAGLQAIHTAKDTRGASLGILHRDVTPENVLVGLDGIGRLADFGIAKSVRSAVHTSPLQLVGKLPFLSPEYIDRGAMGPPLDVYAVGISLWRLLAGHSPWCDLEEAQLLVRILTEGVPALPAEAKIAPDLAAVVARACAKRPEDRYPSALALSDAIEALQANHRIASHADVAALLATCVGAEVEDLRERAAAALSTPSLPPSAEFVADGPDAERSVRVEEERSRDSRYLETTRRTSRPRHSKWRWAAVGLLLTVADVGWFSLAKERSVTPRPLSVRSTETPASPSVTASPSPGPTQRSPSGEAAPAPDLATSPAVEVRPSNPRGTTETAQPRRNPPLGQAVERTTQPATQPSVTGKTAAGPEEIVTRNPYSGSP